jgi:hypothetical protein
MYFANCQNVRSLFKKETIHKDESSKVMVLKLNFVEYKDSFPAILLAYFSNFISEGGCYYCYFGNYVVYDFESKDTIRLAHYGEYKKVKRNIGDTFQVINSKRIKDTSHYKNVNVVNSIWSVDSSGRYYQERIFYHPYKTIIGYLR